MARTPSLPIAILLLLHTAAFAHAERIRLFRGSNFEGWNQVLLSSQPTLGAGGNGYSVKSARVMSGSWLLCADTSFTGDCIWIAHDIRDFKAVGYDKPILSAKPAPVVVMRLRWGGKTPPHCSIVFFAEKNFEGRWLARSESMVEVGPDIKMLWPKSIVVQQGVWKVCSYPDYAGRCITLTGSMRDFASMFGAPIQSVERIEQGRTGARQARAPSDRQLGRTVNIDCDVIVVDR